MDNANKKNNRISINTNVHSMILGLFGCIGCVGIIANEGLISFTNSIFAVLLWGLSVYVLRAVLPEFQGAVTSHKVYAYAFSLIYFYYMVYFFVAVFVLY